VYLDDNQGLNYTYESYLYHNIFVLHFFSDLITKSIKILLFYMMVWQLNLRHIGT